MGWAELDKIYSSIAVSDPERIVRKGSTLYFSQEKKKNGEKVK